MLYLSTGQAHITCQAHIIGHDSHHDYYYVIFHDFVYVQAHIIGQAHDRDHDHEQVYIYVRLIVLDQAHVKAYLRIHVRLIVLD